MADNAKPGILRNLRVKRVSLVDIGANFDTNTGDGAHIMLYKRADVNKDGPGLGTVHVDAPIGSKSINTPRKKPATNHKENHVKKNAFLKFLGLLRETDVEKRNAGIDELEKSFGDDDDVKKAHDPDDSMCKCADCMAKAKRFEGDPEAINLAVSKATTALEKKHAEEIAKVQKIASDAVAAVEVEKQVRLTSEMTAVLKSFRRVPVDLEKDLPVYLAMKAANPAMYDSIIAKMKATEAMLAQSALFTNFGSGLEGSGDAWVQIEAKADAIVEKSSTGISREEAIEKVLLDPKNAALVKQYRGVSVS